MCLLYDGSHYNAASLKLFGSIWSYVSTAKGGMGLLHFRKQQCWNCNVVTGLIRIYFRALGLWPKELENICLCPLLKN